MAEAATAVGTLRTKVSEQPSALRARVREISPRTLDVGLAALVFAGTLLEACLADAPWGARLASAGPGALVAAAIVIRRRAPLASITVGVAGIASANLLDRAVFDALNTAYFAFLFIVYSMAGRESGRRLLTAVAICFAGILLTTATEQHRDTAFLGQVLVGTGFFIIAPVFAGVLLHSRLRLTEALREKAALADADRADGAQEAVITERVRIASELHDLVAHALGAMTIQASAARRLAEVDATRAATAFEAVETTGRDALGELRTLLEVLRDDESEPSAAPQPSLNALPALAERARAVGLGVELDVQGLRPSTLPASVDLTAYRVVQDALRAAREDGGAGSATVTVRYRGDRVDIEIADDGMRVAERRLLGLRERVRLYGGEVSSGAQRPSGHVLRARLPLEGAPA
jgi:signal transduction histidine kinase